MIAVNYCRSCGGGANYGDQLTPALLELAGIPWRWAPPAEAELFAVGSIVSKIPGGFTGTVWGTGTIHAKVRRDLSRARVLGVRGTYTRAACGLPAGTPLGDPGVLAPEVAAAYRPPAGASRPEGGTVLVPHYVDRTLAERWPGAEVVSITTSPPGRFVWAIARASRVITSSLHGLIAADALGIPHVLEPHEAVIGGLWKFRDYASAFRETITPGVERLTSRAAMEDRRGELIESLGRVAG